MKSLANALSLCTRDGPGGEVSRAHEGLGCGEAFLVDVSMILELTVLVEDPTFSGLGAFCDIGSEKSLVPVQLLFVSLGIWCIERCNAEVSTAISLRLDKDCSNEEQSLEVIHEELVELTLINESESLIVLSDSP